LLGAFGQSAGKKDDWIDARHLQVDRNARVFSGTPEVKTCVAATRKANGADTGIPDEPEASFIADVVNHLNSRGRQASCFDGSQGLFGEQPCGVRVERMNLRDHWIARGNGSREVAPADAIKGEGKVVRTEDDYRTDRGEAGTNVFFEVQGGVAPGFFAGSSSSLPELVRCPRKFDVFEARSHGKRGLFGCGCNNGRRCGLDVVGVGFKEGGDLRRLEVAEFSGRRRCCTESEIAVGPAADRERKGKSYALRWIFGVKGSLCVCRPPFSVDQYLSCDLSYIHRCFLSSNC
jgi:hypothetical protein